MAASSSSISAEGRVNMVKCKTCKHTNWCKDEGGRRYNWCPIIDDCPDPEASRDCDKHETMTNADRIRAMSDDERADAILDNSDKCLGDLIPFCQNTPECTDLLENGDDIPKKMCRKCLIEWLQSEVEE